MDMIAQETISSWFILTIAFYGITALSIDAAVEWKSGESNGSAVFL